MHRSPLNRLPIGRTLQLQVPGGLILAQASVLGKWRRYMIRTSRTLRPGLRGWFEQHVAAPFMNWMGEHVAVPRSIRATAARMRHPAPDDA